VVRIEELTAMEPPIPTAIVHGRPRRGFTLIELIIAVALSALIAYAAFAAFRVVAQSVSLTNRLSVENRLMRTGFFAALEELDFWDRYDDRGAADPTTNPLRAVGKPFAKLTYDPTKQAHDPKRWWRGFGFAKDATNTLKWGDFAALSKVGHSDAVRAWLPGQIQTMSQTIGPYGMISYLPGDAIFCYYTSSGTGAVTLGGEPRDVWERTAHDPITANGKSFDKGEAQDLLPLRPEHWPGLEVEVRRYVVWSSFIDLCQVQVVSPISGERMRLSFWGLGTTLRGARQQRDLDTVVSK
jgi:prepilin-type N-terminal cleavage/methylation domain-containing protein